MQIGIGIGIARQNSRARLREYKVIPQSIRDAGLGSAKVFSNGSSVTTDYNFDALPSSIIGNTAYIDPAAAGGGTGTELNPYNSYATAFANGSFNIYLFKSGSRFTGINAAVTVPNGRDIKIGTYGGDEPAYVTSELTGMIFTQNGTYPQVYQSPNAQTSLSLGSALDESNLDINGLPVGLFRVASILLVSQTPNSFYYDSTSDIIYLQTFDTREPDSDIRCFLNSTTLRLMRLSTPGATTKFYCENIRFQGGNPFVLLHTDVANFYNFGFKNCHFSYSGQKDGILISGLAKGFLKDCRADYPIGDGFNYTGADGFVLEWSSESETSTERTSPGNNGSTSHDGYKILRVLGRYTKHSGKTIQDINNSLTVSIRCVGGESVGSDPNNYVFASNSSTGNTTMYLIECQSLDARGYDNFNNSTMYIYDGSYGNLLTKTNRDQVGSVLELLSEEEVFG